MQTKREQARVKENSDNTNVSYNNNSNYYSNVNDNTTYEDNINNRNYDKEHLKYEKRLQQEELKQRKKMQENLNKEYENAYYNYLKSLGYKVKHKWTKKNFLDLIIVIGIMIGIFIILWFIPPTHNWMVNFYEENVVLRKIIDIIVAVITGIFTGIWTFITGLFS